VRGLWVAAALCVAIGWGTAGSAVPVQAAAIAASPDYSIASWVPAASTNYSVADRPHDYPVDMIVIHDIEGSAGSAIKAFQDPTRLGSAHYVISYTGAVTQMVLEKDIAWHAGNWDYNTRSIGIEHAGYACCNYYTTAEYNASAHLAAWICSRWGVTLDRTHVIGHYQVPDPYHPGLYGGAEHHTDPGPYWNWTYYLNLARTYASSLPSPPHLGPDPTAYSGDTTATVTWRAAHTCHLPVTGYTVTAQPGNIVQQVAANVTSATFTGLRNGVSYTFTVTTQNADGTDTLTSNAVVPDPACTAASVTPSLASPQQRGAKITFTATSATCPNPRYEFWIQTSSGWYVEQGFGGRTTWTWDTSSFPAATFTVRVWADEATSNYGVSQSQSDAVFTINPSPPCSGATLAPVESTQAAGTTVSFTGDSSACPYPMYEYWVQMLDGRWYMRRGFSSDRTWGWSTVGLRPGKYTVHVWANQAGDQTAALESVASSTVTLTGCTSATLIPASGSVKVGTAVLFTARSTGCPNPVYEFWLQDTRGYWHLMRGFGAATWTWNNAGWGKGTYHIHAWAMPTGAFAGAYEVFGSSTFKLT
jgi:N-acetyl-anhydromuramyl-L-alanine amidase AmpD